MWEKIMEIGFEYNNKNVEEFLPSIDNIVTLKQKRKLFFTLYNLSVKKSLKIDKINLNKDIFTNFLSKINNTLGLSIFNKTEKKIEKFLINDTIKINSFLSHIKSPYLKNIKFTNQKIASSDFELSITKLIDKIYDNSSIYLKQNLQELFINYVMENMKLKNKSNIYQENRAIYIKNSTSNTKVYPMWKHIDSKNIDNILSDINSAIDEINSSNLTQLYLVYPKNEDFCKHIIVNANIGDKRLKLIPYSFRKIARAIRG
jgi:hypothetical protein